MISYGKESRKSLAQLCLMIDVMRDEVKVKELLSVKQTIPTQIALRKLQRLLRERRNLYR